MAEKVVERRPLKRLLAEAELEKDAFAGGHWKVLSPAAKRRVVDMLKDTLSMSERLACKAVGLARSTYRRLPQAQPPADRGVGGRRACATSGGRQRNRDHFGGNRRR